MASHLHFLDSHWSICFILQLQNGFAIKVVSGGPYEARDSSCGGMCDQFGVFLYEDLVLYNFYENPLVSVPHMLSIHCGT